MKTLLIDNYDSYTFNLFQFLAEVNGEEPAVVRNDATTWPELADGGWANIVISPGPGNPSRPRDFGICADALRLARVPVLGVCLGHQGLAMAAGGDVGRAPVPMHGRISRIWHDGSELFAGIPQGYWATRYHSLIAHDPLPATLRRIAWSADGLIMAMRHLHKPQWGVQFHPESIATEHGIRLLENFRNLTRAAHYNPHNPRGRWISIPRQAAPAASAHSQRPDPAGAAAAAISGRTPYRLHVQRIDSWVEPEQAFDALFGHAPTAFWLDSSRVEPGLARFSYLGAQDGPLSHVITYDVTRRQVKVRGKYGETCQAGTLFRFLSAALARTVGAQNVPFGLVGGYVGYFGYELKADCGASMAHRSSHPDATLIFADRYLVFDHEQRRIHLVALVDEEIPGADDAAAAAWCGRVRQILTEAPALPEPDVSGLTDVVAEPDADRETYKSSIKACLEELAAGESYEICLTSRVRGGPVAGSCFEIYRVLRRINPAPYAAYLRFGKFEVLSSSPERFLRIGKDRWIEAKPIKGTAPRHADPAADAREAARLRTDEKSRAENLMIVDLLRNDLGVVSEIGTVHVPRLMSVETYETVHQLVSTVRGRLRPALTAVDCLRATFPGGSMTGAPKLRTMQIIDRLEPDARGIYAGAIGYLSLDGAADLSIVIRTIVSDETGITLGTGGAIVAQSDPDGEYDEILLKAFAPCRALAIARRNSQIACNGAANVAGRIFG
jgi:para-aminobenzoate synthetase